jgi:hypothetical protein
MNPITPEEALKQCGDRKIPVEVIGAFNQLIVDKTENRGDIRIKITIDEIVPVVLERFAGSNFNVLRQQIFDNKWLDVEPLFRNAGWKVEFVKTPYYDPSPGYFIFERKS